jgi:hypothetical protein
MLTALFARDLAFAVLVGKLDDQFKGERMLAISAKEDLPGAAVQVFARSA